MSRTERIKTPSKIVNRYYERTNEPIEGFMLIDKIMAIEKVTKGTAKDYVNVARNAGEIRFVKGHAYAPGQEPPEVNINVVHNTTTKTTPETLFNHENRLRKVEEILKSMGHKL